MPTPWTTSPKRNGWLRWTGVRLRAVLALRRQQHGPGVVAIDPVGIGLSAQPRIGARGLLNLRRAILSRRLEAAKRVSDTVTTRAFEAARQHGGVFDRHRGALRHVRRHR